MYKKKSGQISMFETPNNFMMASGLNPNNRWIVLANRIPWEKIEEKYSGYFSKTKFSKPAKDARIAIGCLILKDRLGLSDEQTIEAIIENPYLQYFIGMKQFSNTSPIEASSLTRIRNRIGIDVLVEINEMIIDPDYDDKHDDDDDSNDSNSNLCDCKKDKNATNEGTLILDATCIPANMKYPTDIDLLNSCREHLEKMIDTLHDSNTHGKKPRTYRRVADKHYKSFIRNRKPSKKLVKTTIKKQLSYISRDLRHLDRYDLEDLSEQQKEDLEIIKIAVDQQKYMLENNVRKVQDRILSLSQPFVRPIKRGKANADTEFGAKVAISIERGFLRMEHFSFNAFNESTTLINSVKSYYKRNGIYPQRILADKIYRTSANLKFCKKHNIHMSGPKLGRPPKDKELYKQQKLLERSEAGERNEVEGKIGTAKTCYSWSRLSSKNKHTSTVEIHLSMINMNLSKILRDFVFTFFREIFTYDFRSVFQ